MDMSRITECIKNTENSNMESKKILKLHEQKFNIEELVTLVY